ncbi:MAG TPA: hypothetical protein VNK82_10565 [Terriglobales bacterium]|nr:hypothetical protein [Terriglobales bacterium]
MASSRHILVACLLAPLLVAPAAADQKPGRLTKEQRFDLLRGLSSELVYVRKPFPMGQKGLVLRPDGTLAPSERELGQALMKHGVAAKPGDRARITKMEIRDDNIVFEINGGPVKKKKWYQRIQLQGAAGSAPVAQAPPDFSPGSMVVLQFKGYVPSLTVDQVKELLKPVFDFSSHSPLQAYVDTLPPKAKEAILKHEVLVGMNREMVTFSKGRPPRKIREKEADIEYEEWIYGQPPQDVEFIRFVGDEVVQVKTMKMTGEKIVRTEKEVDVRPEGATEVAAQNPEAQPKPAAQPQKQPTLRRAGEAPIDQPDNTGGGPVILPEPGPNDPAGRLPGPGPNPQ